MDPIIFLTIEDIEYLHKMEMEYSGKSGWVRDRFELEACIEAPKASFDGKYLNDIYMMAAKYISSICIRHPFSDGNKRVAALAAVIFLETNGYDYQEKIDCELSEVILSYLKKQLSDESLIQHIKERTH